MRKFIIIFFTIIFSISIWSADHTVSVASQDVGDKLIIVIDPGHGGENLGTIENNHEEKLMTLPTAMAMYEELLKYDNVQVFLTRTDDRDMSLKERAQFAANVGADFLFSIHYNASANHEMHGAEVWTSAFAPYNNYGYQFGYELLTQLNSWGLVNRGVKTRLNNGGKDYYGIIREALALNIPAVIIEHCHVDEIHDTSFCDSPQDYEAFGIADATAVAKYFGLKSMQLGVDYSDYVLTNTDTTNPVPITLTDQTEPDVCEIDFYSADYEACNLKLTVTAADYDSPLLYYSYSIDGGKTFSLREEWPETNTLTGTYTNTFTLSLDIPSGTKPEIILRAYNMFDLYTESNIYLSERSFFYPTVEATATPAPQPEFTIIPVADTVSDTEGSVQGLDLWDIIKLFLIALIMILSMIVTCQACIYRIRKRRD